MYDGVLYFRNGLHEFYKIDLDCLPEILEPIPNFNDNYAGCTVVDECIYCIGGIKEKETIEGYRRTVCNNLNKYNTANPSSTWDFISPASHLRLFEPSVFSRGRNIYVVGGSPSPFKSDWYGVNTDPAYWGEYYNLDSQTWSYLPKQTFIDLCGFHAAMDQNQNTILFHSILSNILLLYDVDKEKWTEQHHPDLMLQNMVVRQGLEKCNCLPALLYVANSRPAVVCHSTLYWLNNDMCLYGYDYVLRRWFQSNGLPIDWSLSVHHESICFASRLFYLNDQTFVAICDTGVGAKLEMRMAIFGVERHPDRIVVTLKLHQNFHVNSPIGKISVYDGMAIRKDQGSVLGKRKSASEY